MKKKLFLTRCIAVFVLVAMLFTACGNKKPANTEPSISTSVLENCQEVLQAYLAENADAEGLVVYSEGTYFAVVNKQLYAAKTVTAHTFEGAGETILPAVAQFRGVPCVGDKACNYALEAVADGKTYHISFCIEGTVESPVFPAAYNKDGVQIAKGVVGQITAAPVQASPVKNIIYMIADGGGYDNFTLAGKVKEEMLDRGVNKLSGAKTEVTTDLLADIGIASAKGLYLDSMLVGSANTLLVTPHGDADDYKSYITDSSAAGTALSSGYKTSYSYAGVTSDGVPRASLPELARMNGMSTGLVTNKSYVDATPLAFFTAHSIHRKENIDNSMQALLSGIDVVIGEGTEYGDLKGIDESTHPDLSTSKMGYVVARDKTQLIAQAKTATKLWAPILGVDNTLKELKDFDYDNTTDHISYDVDAAQSSEQPSLLDMTKAALQVLGDNIDNPEGFFLMIEGGALDNAAEGGNLRPAIGEYLAFDEAFGYCVNWAAKRGDTIVIAVPDHDSGGFSGIESCEDMLIDGIITGSIGGEELHNMLGFEELKFILDAAGGDTSNMQLLNGHTDMAVPISLYAPEGIRQEVLTNLTLPTVAGNVRTGSNEYYVPNESGSFTWYASSALNKDYVIENTKIAPALAKTLNLGSLEEATQILFNKAPYAADTIVSLSEPHSNSFGDYYPATYTSGSLLVERNSHGYTLNGQKQDIPKIGNQQPMTVYVIDSQETPDKGTFYMPVTVLAHAGSGWTATVSCEQFGFDKVLYAEGNGPITLPDAPAGMQILYTDGTNVYNAGDAVSYTSGNIALQAYVKPAA